MILELESAYGDRYLEGKRLTRGQLESIAGSLWATVGDEGFAEAFCARTGCRELPWTPGYAHFVIDLDTHGIYEPHQSFPAELNGGRVLFHTDKGLFAPILDSGGQTAHEVSYLAVCTWPDDESFYLLHCDDQFRVVADDCYDTLDRCKASRDVIWKPLKAPK